MMVATVQIYEISMLFYQQGNNSKPEIAKGHNSNISFNWFKIESDDLLLTPNQYTKYQLIVLGFNDTSTFVGHFVSSPREREKRDRRDSRRDEREGQGRKRNRNESENIEEIKTFPLYPYLLQG